MSDDILHRFDADHECDRQTDGQTELHLAYTVPCFNVMCRAVKMCRILRGVDFVSSCMLTEQFCCQNLS